MLRLAASHVAHLVAFRAAERGNLRFERLPSLDVARVVCGMCPPISRSKVTMTKTAAEKESECHPMPWRAGEKPTISAPPPTTTLPEEHPAPLYYQEESEGHPMPWRPAEKPDAGGDTS